MRCWCGYLPGARCRLFAYDPADATAIPKPHHLLPLKSRLVLSFCYRLTQAVLEKRPLNGCSSSSTTTVTYHYNVQSVENCVADDYKLSMDSKRAATEKFCRNNPKRMYILLTALKQTLHSKVRNVTVERIQQPVSTGELSLMPPRPNMRGKKSISGLHLLQRCHENFQNVCKLHTHNRMNVLILKSAKFSTSVGVTVILPYCLGSTSGQYCSHLR